jgi:hypothetical protein
MNDAVPFGSIEPGTFFRSPDWLTPHLFLKVEPMTRPTGPVPCRAIYFIASDYGYGGISYLGWDDATLVIPMEVDLNVKDSK